MLTFLHAYADTCLYAEQVWSATAEAAKADSESGAIARMHSALIAVLTHVVTRLGTPAFSNPQALSHSQSHFLHLGCWNPHVCLHISSKDNSLRYPLPDI